MMATNMSRLQEEMNNIPLADEDATESEAETPSPTIPSQPIISRNTELNPPTYTFMNGTSSPVTTSLDPDISPDEAEEKARLIAQVLELQNTLDDLSQRVDSVKEENLKLKSENQVLGQYIENLMSASSVFQSTSPKAKKKGSTRGKK
ncbi:short coiled-coil protein B isoform X2 [Centruroides vittatus]|uniref:short coiled-coil protein B-like isoform X2 n=1 Tax=Centruroides sculpturatus TaxID=218467 RepID=UPI000C6E3312|nr:short coiled-coil protein B-like isoform X2 [Centruroides sculpturatus]